MVTPAGGGRPSWSRRLRPGIPGRSQGAGGPSAHLRDGAVRCRSSRVREIGDGAGPATIARTGDTPRAALHHWVAEHTDANVPDEQHGWHRVAPGAAPQHGIRNQMRQGDGVSGTTARSDQGRAPRTLPYVRSATEHGGRQDQDNRTTNADGDVCLRMRVRVRVRIRDVPSRVSTQGPLTALLEQLPFPLRPG